MVEFFGPSSRIFKYSHTMGRLEYTGAGFRNPVDLALGTEDRIYVASRCGEENPKGIRVTICNVNEEYLGEFGSYGEGDGQFMWPASIALDSQENLYLADEWLNRISVWDRGGTFLDKWGIKGSGAGELNRPSGLAFDKDDNLYLVDSGNHRIQIFSRHGKYLEKFGEFGTGNGQFNTPWGITTDAEGDVYVADWRNDRVQKFAPDGRFVAAFGSPGELIGQFNRPTGVAVDKDGDIYVTDWGNHRVHVLSSQWRHTTFLAGDATLSKWGEQKLRANPDAMRQYLLVPDKSLWKYFWYPMAVEVDATRRIVIVDSSCHRLQFYVKELVA